MPNLCPARCSAGAPAVRGRNGYRHSRAETGEVEKPVVRAMTVMERHRRTPQPTDIKKAACLSLRALCPQNQHRNVAWGTVRLIECMPALVVEKALRCLLSREHRPRWAYEVARDHGQPFNTRSAQSQYSVRPRWIQIVSRARGPSCSPAKGASAPPRTARARAEDCFPSRPRELHRARKNLDSARYPARLEQAQKSKAERRYLAHYDQST